VASWQRAATDLIDVAEAMPEDKSGYKPTPEIATFRDQLVTSRASRSGSSIRPRGSRARRRNAHGEMKKAEVIALLKKTLQSGQETLGSLTDAQLRSR